MTDHVTHGGFAAIETERQEASRNRAAAERGDAPLLPYERLWGFWEFTYANSALAIATWAFLIGGSVGLFVGPKEGIAAIVIGNIVGVMLTALATTPLSAATASSSSSRCAASSATTAAASSMSWPS